MRTICIRTILFVLSCAGALIGQQTSPPATPSESPSVASAKDKPQFQERTPRYRIAAGDVFEVLFEFTPEFNQTVTVQPDGFVTLRGVGDFHVSGQSVPELTQIISAAYEKILYNPSISVELKDVQRPYFIVGGQVARPGKYELRESVTLTQAIAVAGGFNGSAKHSQVVLFRYRSPNLYETKLINVKKMMNSRDLNEDPRLGSGDTVFVPQNSLSKIRQFVPNPGIGVGTNF